MNLSREYLVVTQAFERAEDEVICGSEYVNLAVWHGLERYSVHLPQMRGFVDAETDTVHQVLRDKFHPVDLSNNPLADHIKRVEDLIRNRVVLGEQFTSEVWRYTHSQARRDMLLRCIIDGGGLAGPSVWWSVVDIPVEWSED